FHEFVKMGLTLVENAFEIYADAGEVMTLHVIKQLLDRIGASLGTGKHSGEHLTFPLLFLLIEVVDERHYPGLWSVDPDDVLSSNLLPVRIIFGQGASGIGKVKELADHYIQVGVRILKVLPERGHTRFIPVHVKRDAQRLAG